MRKLAGMLTAIAMVLAVIAPALAQSCTLSTGTLDQECFGIAFQRGGVIVCKDDTTGQAGICDSERRCATCTPANGCTETYVRGFVGCSETGAPGITETVQAETSPALSAPVTGFAVTGGVFGSGYVPGFEIVAAASAAVLGSGVALVLRKARSTKMRRTKIRSLEQEKKELKHAKFDYAKVGIILIALGVGSIVAGASRVAQTGNFAESLTSISWRWVVLGLFALAIIYYAWLCRADAKKRLKA